MKPEGRSLEFAVVGLGQAGGNLATEFFRRGYPALALNTAQTDLNALDPGGLYPSMPDDQRIYIGLDGYDGAGMDPNYAAECVTENAHHIREAVLHAADGADAVFLAAGLGGGTGSALNALVDVLRPEELPMIGMMTLPMDSESGIVKVNAVRAINELVDASLDGWIFVDNARISELNQDVSIVDYYAHINGRIASPIDGFNRLNEREDLRPIRSFDGEDFRKLLLAGGVISYGVVELPSLRVDDVLSSVRNSLETGDLMPSGFDLESVTYLGLVVEATEADLTNASIGSFEDVDEKLKAQTGGAAIYRGIYRTSEPDVAPQLRIIASTQTLPHRIREILSDAQREGHAIREKLQEQLPTLELGEIENFDFFRPAARAHRSERPRKSKKPAQNQEIEDLQEEIVTPRRPAAATQKKKKKKATQAKRPGSRRPAGRPVPPSRVASQRPTPGRPSIPVPPSRLMPDDSTEAETNEATNMEDLIRRSRLPDGIELPSDVDIAPPEEYDRLVSDFLHSRDANVRETIAEQLARDCMSPHTAVRYYAVEAMSKLGRDSFGEALLSATEDENEAIRDVAIQALRS